MNNYMFMLHVVFISAELLPVTSLGFNGVCHHHHVGCFFYFEFLGFMLHIFLLAPYYFQSQSARRDAFTARSSVLKSQLRVPPHT